MPSRRGEGTGQFFQLRERNYSLRFCGHVPCCSFSRFLRVGIWRRLRATVNLCTSPLVFFAVSLSAVFIVVFSLTERPSCEPRAGIEDENTPDMDCSRLALSGFESVSGFVHPVFQAARASSVVGSIMVSLSRVLCSLCSSSNTFFPALFSRWYGRTPPSGAGFPARE